MTSLAIQQPISRSVVDLLEIEDLHRVDSPYRPVAALEVKHRMTFKGLAVRLLHLFQRRPRNDGVAVIEMHPYRHPLHPPFRTGRQTSVLECSHVTLVSREASRDATALRAGTCPIAVTSLTRGTSLRVLNTYLPRGKLCGHGGKPAGQNVGFTQFRHDSVTHTS